MEYGPANVIIRVMRALDARSTRRLGTTCVRWEAHVNKELGQAWPANVPNHFKVVQYRPLPADVFEEEYVEVLRFRTC